MHLAVETELETDGRRIAEIPLIPGTLAYGAGRREAIARRFCQLPVFCPSDTFPP